jgi:hypothetical protein
MGSKIEFGDSMTHIEVAAAVMREPHLFTEIVKAGGSLYDGHPRGLA